MTCDVRKLCCAFVLPVLFLNLATSVCSAAEHGFAALNSSVNRTTDTVIGKFSSSHMVVDVVLAPNNEAQLSSLLADVYNPQSKNYQHWLGQGEFYARFAPTAKQAAAVTAYLKESGLDVEESSSPFLVRVSGPSNMIETAFKTNLQTFRNAKGVEYFSNASEVQLPEELASGVRGVIGLSNTVRLHPMAVRPLKQSKPTNPSCETPYVTTAQLYNAVDNGVGFPYGYGGGPECSGLTPSQDNSIYDAPNFGPYGKGAGVNLAVFELSAYQHSDIDTWAQTFYGPHYNPPLVDITVDGGPLAPICPVGDQCPAEFNGYSGDVEVDADIEMQLAIAPNASHILVYNAPNDFTGQTELDNYTKIAKDNLAAVISSSWGVCENDVSVGYAEAENLLFEQMALQGQSVFIAGGDTGAFGCIRTDGTTVVNIGDPGGQPWVTNVGGTSLESFNPDANPDPNYPTGVETVWNVDNLCNTTSGSEGGVPGLDWCALTGAGAGGVSQYWARPAYQVGPGVNNAYTKYGPSQCALAKPGQACREAPDVSINADEFTPYAEYCSGNASTPYSGCTEAPFWFGIGGTSLASPFWSAIIADRVSASGVRVGNANPLLYLLFNLDAPGYFHDITGVHQTTNNNGLYPTTPGYDLATGIGTPKMSAIITLVPQN